MLNCLRGIIAQPKPWVLAYMALIYAILCLLIQHSLAIVGLDIMILTLTIPYPPFLLVYSIRMLDLG